MHEDVVDTARQFVAEIITSDDPPETLPISEIMELKEVVDKLCTNFKPPELPSEYPFQFYQEEQASLSTVTPSELAEQLTIMLSNKIKKLTPMDFALFYQNENIILDCPRIVEYYEIVDRVCVILTLWFCTYLKLSIAETVDLNSDYTSSITQETSGGY